MALRVAIVGSTLAPVSALLVTFGDGARRYRAAANRLGRQAQSSGWFDAVWAIDDISRYPEFHEAHRRILNSDTRGFGYWIWKPYLLVQAARAGFDHVVYADAGCVLNVRDRANARLDELLQMADERPLLAMGTGHSESRYTKRATWEHFGLNADQLADEQVGATILIMRSREALDLVTAYLEACIVDDYRLVDDSPSGKRELCDFTAHRHDQSVLSCLMKGESIKPIADESYFPNGWLTDGAEAPIWAARHRWGTPFPVTGLWRRSLFLCERQFG